MFSFNKICIYGFLEGYLIGIPMLANKFYGNCINYQDSMIIIKFRN